MTKKIIKPTKKTTTVVNIPTVEKEKNQTLNQWIRTFIYTYKKGTIKDSSIARYLSTWKKDIEPYPIGKVRLSDLRAIHMQDHIKQMQKEKKPLTKMKQAKGLIVTAVNYAVALDLIPTNKVRLAILPKDYNYRSEAENISYLEPEEQKAIVSSLPQTVYGFAIDFDFSTGLRKGELIALTWDCLDMEHCTVRINKTFMQAHILNKKNQIVYRKQLTTPKSKSSYRTIPYPKRYNERFRQLRYEQQMNKKYHKVHYTDHNLIFCDELGNFLDKKRLPRLLDKTTESLGIAHLKFHGIRHCYATRLFEQGVDIKTVSTLLGHADTTVTDRIYTHVTKYRMHELNKIIQEHI